MAGGEDLVPALDDEGGRVVVPRRLHGIDYSVHLYRPRVESAHARIERWVRETPEQWLWIHRRWKTQPGAGPANGKPREARG